MDDETLLTDRRHHLFACQQQPDCSSQSARLVQRVHQALASLGQGKAVVGRACGRSDQDRGAGAAGRRLILVLEPGGAACVTDAGGGRSDPRWKGAGRCYRRDAAANGCDSGKLAGARSAVADRSNPLTEQSLAADSSHLPATGEIKTPSVAGTLATA